MGKKILIVGSGGREHAMAWKLSTSPHLDKLYIAPGNAGTSQLGENVPLNALDITGLAAFAKSKHVDFTVVGPDDPLAAGIVDEFMARGLRIFGPTKAAAEIEWSKAYAKSLMHKHHIPTASFFTTAHRDEAVNHARMYFGEASSALVVKADGLALGKGVYICQNYQEAEAAIDEIMIKKVHGLAGIKVVLEDFVAGNEVSLHAFCDGVSFSLFPTAQDHKSQLEGDKGPNTGGMGTIAPVPWFSGRKIAKQRIVSKILTALKADGRPFTGCLYPGIKVEPDGGEAMVLEYNARFGDPETQVYMRLLKTDLLEIIEACIDGKLDKIDVQWYQGFAACIVLASEGYPGVYKKDRQITGIEAAEKLHDLKVFHAGTVYEDGKLRTSGGRVLGVTSWATTLKDAISYAYEGIEKIHFKGKQFRKDIGKSSLLLGSHHAH